ncbi:MAG: hypothetical protein JWQ86_3756 [Mycobacterium sp.]|jgi:hypothetical protein|nr:hypothetical protein [Mycobacterium sp.]
MLTSALSPDIWMSIVTALVGAFFTGGGGGGGGGGAGAGFGAAAGPFSLAEVAE